MIKKIVENEGVQNVLQKPATQTVLKFLKANGTLVALVILMLIFSFSDEAFFTPRNLTNLARQATIIGIIAVGMTMVILINGIDLGVGSIVGLSAISVTMMMQAGVNMWLAVLLTLILVGGGIGLWNGFWIAHYDIPPFIITLAVMTIARGMALVFSKGGSIPVEEPRFRQIGGSFLPKGLSAVVIVAALAFFFYSLHKSIQEKKKYGIEVHIQDIVTSSVIAVAGLGLAFWVFTSYRGIPTPVIIFVIIVFISSFILRNTKFGRRLYAMGGNEEAARLSGINIYQTKVIVFCVVTVLAALAGILLASRLNGASPNLGNMFELFTISAVIIGGTSFAGGIGTITGTVVGVFIIGVLENGMSLLGVPMQWQFIVRGFIIILAVWFDVLTKKKKG
jgi:D-xylose transport system permease protein